MIPGQSIKVVILGVGKGGTALLELFTRISGVEILGVADKDPNAPGLRRARELSISVIEDVDHLIANDKADLIVDVTGDPAMKRVFIERKPVGVEVLGGKTAKLFLYVVQHEADMSNQLLHVEKLATIGTFTSGIAHEINNPLYPIMVLAEEMLDEQDPTVIRKHAGDILQTVKRIVAIVRGMTGYARATLTEDVGDVELNTKLDEAVKMAQYATALNEITVMKDYAVIPVIMAKPEEIVQVFVNLINNAVQAMDGKGTLTLSTRCEDGNVTVEISDTGPGIPQDLVSKIFDPFFTTKDPGKGTGLGLHVVQTLVRRYGGLISVASEEGKGTTFQLRFPVGEQACE